MITDGQVGAALAVSDMGRATKFYGETLGFTAAMESEGGTLYTGGKGTAFFVYPSEFAGTNKATAMSINVDDFDATVEDLRGKGISFLDYDMPGLKTENGVARTPDGPAAWFADPDGNLINITQM